MNKKEYKKLIYTLKNNTLTLKNIKSFYQVINELVFSQEEVEVGAAPSLSESTPDKIIFDVISDNNKLDYVESDEMTEKIISTLKQYGYIIDKK